MRRRVQGLNKVGWAGGLAVVLMASLVLSGCADVDSASAPASSSRAQLLLQRVLLPAGSEQLTYSDVGPVPLQSSDLGCAGLLEKAEYWRVSGMSIDALQGWLERHVPIGLEVTGTGSGGDRAGQTMTEVDLGVRSRLLAPAGSRVVLSAVHEGSRTVLRADAQVVPTRGCRAAARYGPLHGPAVTARS